MDLYNDSMSHVGIHETFVPNDEEICYDCRWPDPYGWSYGCKCPTNSQDQINYSGVWIVYQLRVNGVPAKMRPAESDYNVRKFVQSGARQAELSIYDLTDENLVEEFTISSTEDPRDLEQLYGKMVKDLGSGWKPTSERSNFTAKDTASNYVDHFTRIVDSIMHPPPPREASENAHVGLRKKKTAKGSRT